jgi:spermidine/putrescine transport system permease protein
LAERRRPVFRAPPLLVLPTLGWLMWFLLAPLVIVLAYSFARKGVYGGVIYDLGARNYVRAGDWLYVRIFLDSLRLATVTSLSCLLIGFPMAYVMATARPAARSGLLMLVVIPFWTNFVVRAYAIKLILGERGPVNQALLALRLIAEPLPLANSQLAVWIGMVTNYLPFMVLPLYVALEKFDFTLLEAGRDLGARSWHLLFRILVPMTRAGILTGLIFVFTPALGEFVIPDLLGGARTILIGNVITDQFLKTRDWPFGSALSVVLILTVLGSLVLYLRSGAEAEESAEGA